MVFRLPTHLESLVPPPSEQVPQPRPWRGTFVLNTADGNHKGVQEISLTAVETDGDNSRADLWPSQFVIYMTRERSTLSEVQAWVKRHSPPICTFMPDRMYEANENSANQKNFGSLSRILLHNQTVSQKAVSLPISSGLNSPMTSQVAVAPWNASDRLPGAGIVLFPTQMSTNLLFGAIFLTSPFPDFVTMSPTMSFSPSPTLIPSRQPYPQPIYQQQMGYTSPYASTSQQGALVHAGPSRQPQSSANYRYNIPRLASAGSLPSPSTAGPSPWSTVTDPDDERR